MRRYGTIHTRYRPGRGLRLHLVSTGFFRNATPDVLEVARVLVERGSDVNNVGWDGNNNLCAADHSRKLGGRTRHDATAP